MNLDCSDSRLHISCLPLRAREALAATKAVFAHFHLASLCSNGITHTFPSSLEKGIWSVLPSLESTEGSVYCGGSTAWKPTDCANSDVWCNKAATKRAHCSVGVLELWGFLLSSNHLCGYLSGFIKLHLFSGNAFFCFYCHYKKQSCPCSTSDPTLLLWQ